MFFVEATCLLSDFSPVWVDNGFAFYSLLKKGDCFPPSLSLIMASPAHLAAFILLLLLADALAYFNPTCKQACPHRQICCARKNGTGDTCCPDSTSFYSNMAVVTRKLSGVLIMLLLFAIGYFFQRMLCSRSRQPPPPQRGPPPVTTSQELLMESCASDSLDELPPRLPSYDECKLPTYEETVRDGGRGRTVSTVGQATWGASMKQTLKSDRESPESVFTQRWKEAISRFYTLTWPQRRDVCWNYVFNLLLPGSKMTHGALILTLRHRG